MQQYSQQNAARQQAYIQAFNPTQHAVMQHHQQVHMNAMAQHQMMVVHQQQMMQRQQQAMMFRMQAMNGQRFQNNMGAHMAAHPMAHPVAPPM